MPRAMTTFDTLHAVRWRAVGTSFLRRRPWIAGAGALVNTALAVASGAPRRQIAVLGALTGSMVLAFAVEASLLRPSSRRKDGRERLDARWLATSLVLTAVGIGVAASASGGLESPVLALLFAPVTIGLAAFGQARTSAWIGGVAVAIIAALALAPPLFPALPMPHRGLMIGWGVIVAFALVALGVIGLVESSRATGRALDRVRADLLDEAARRARDQENLGAKVAHEIRNPLTAVKGLVQILSKKADGDRDARRFGVALAEIERVERILEEYLSLARPLTDLAPAALDARALLEDVGAIVEGRAAEGGVRIVLGDTAAGPLVADPRRLREALLNVVQNAIQATPRGGSVALEAAREGGQIVLSVRDDGRGMDADALAAAGTPFTSGRDGGTGLGLALARSVARQHGGDLTLESELGRGTTVRLAIPERLASGAAT